MNQSLETIATFSFAPQMGFVRSKLESEGIECFVKDEMVSQTYMQNAVGGMKLQVKTEDVEQAKKIVEEMGLFDKPEDQPSRLGSFDRATKQMPLFGALSLFVRFFAVLVLIAVVLSLVYVLVVL